MNPNSALIDRLQSALLTSLAPHASDGDYSLLDFPNHGNVGDSAIYVGELAAFGRLIGRGPDFVNEVPGDDLDLLARLSPTGPIFLHGGGNFGDIWSHHHILREKVVEQFPDRTIVQLPQSVQFSDVAKRDETAAWIAAHPNFTLFVRDHPSLELAERHFDCPVRLAPDSAFMIGALERIGPIELDLLLLIRTDKESALQPSRVETLRQSGAAVEDWLVEPRLPTIGETVAGRLYRHVPALRDKFAHRRSATFERWATARVHRGLRQLSRARFVVTDRLHVHILCLLLGIPHVVLDNSYGKIGRFIDAWTKGGHFWSASDLDEAMDIHRTCCH